MTDTEIHARLAGCTQRPVRLTILEPGTEPPEAAEARHRAMRESLVRDGSARLAMAETASCIHALGEGRVVDGVGHLVRALAHIQITRGDDRLAIAIANAGSLPPVPPDGIKRVRVVVGGRVEVPT